MVGPRVLFVRFVRRSRGRTSSVATYSKKPRYRAWNYIGATYDYNTGVATLWLNSRPVARQSIGRFDLATNYPVRMGARIGDRRAFHGKIACLQVYSVALTAKQIRGARKRCFKKSKSIWLYLLKRKTIKGLVKEIKQVFFLRFYIVFWQCLEEALFWSGLTIFLLSHLSSILSMNTHNPFNALTISFSFPFSY